MSDHGNSGTGGALFTGPRCEWNLTGGYPIEQCPNEGTEDRDGEHYCPTHAAMVDADD